MKELANELDKSRMSSLEGKDTEEVILLKGIMNKIKRNFNCILFMI